MIRFKNGTCFKPNTTVRLMDNTIIVNKGVIIAGFSDIMVSVNPNRPI